jgi:hypothetical protein
MHAQEEAGGGRPSELDPLLLSSEWGSSLFVGVSGTGKTTLILAALKKHIKNKTLKPRRLFCINTRGNEYDQLGGATASIDKINTLPKGSFLVVEDIIDLGKKSEVLMRTTLNVNLHHRSQKMFAATHSNVKTKLWSNIQYFDYIIFPGEKSNHVNFRSIINLFRLGKNPTESFSAAFLERCGRPTKEYIVLAVKEIRIYSGRSLEAMTEQQPDCYTKIGDLESEGGGGRDEPASGVPLANQFEKLITGYKYKGRALAVYSLLENCILSRFTLTPDLLITVGRTGKLKISIVDYIHYLVDGESGRPPPKYLIFHKFVMEKCHVPHLMVQNKFFRSP